MSFENEFLTFWNDFIRHEDTIKELVEETERDEQGKEIITKQGIQLGELLEFFWRLFDSKQLHNFKGKFIKPNKPKVEELIPKITKALDVRLKEMKEQLLQINSQLSLTEQNFTTSFNESSTSIVNMLSIIAKKIE